MKNEKDIIGLPEYEKKNVWQWIMFFLKETWYLIDDIFGLSYYSDEEQDRESNIKKHLHPQ